MTLLLLISIGNTVAPTVATVATIIDVRRHKSLIFMGAVNWILVTALALWRTAVAAVISLTRVCSLMTAVVHHALRKQKYVKDMKFLEDKLC